MQGLRKGTSEGPVTGVETGLRSSLRVPWRRRLRVCGVRGQARTVAAAKGGRRGQHVLSSVGTVCFLTHLSLMRYQWVR